MNPDHDILRDRIRQCVPLRHPAFGKLLQLLSIEISDSVPTAAVTTGERSRLLVNPDFVARRCRSDAHLAMLVMHELYHVLLGHTRLACRPTLAANWAFDCIVNAQLCRMHPALEFTSFFAAGAADEGPWQLIAPPPGWPARPRYARGALGDVHRRLYDDQGVTTAELFALLQTIAVTLDASDAARLLGNHDTEPDADPLHADAELHAEVRRLVARWPMVDHRGGVDDGQDATARQDALARHAAARREVRRLLRVAARGSAGGPPLRRDVDLPAIVPLPQSYDRRAQLLRLVGAQPLMWQGTMRQPHRDDAGQVTVYLDVSGSMAAWLPVLLAALTDEAALVRWPILGFSTQVHAVSRTQLAAGRFRSTGGTDIACVARHLLRERVRRAVVITDGEVQVIPTALMERLGRARPRVRVGLIGGGDAGFGEALGWPVTRLPALDEAVA